MMAVNRSDVFDKDEARKYSGNGVSLYIFRPPKKKLPVLTVGFDEEDATYVVAHFVSETHAKWFMEIFEEQFMKGAIKDGETE